MTLNCQKAYTVTGNQKGNCYRHNIWLLLVLLTYFSETVLLCQLRQGLVHCWKYVSSLSLYCAAKGRAAKRKGPSEAHIASMKQRRK